MSLKYPYIPAKMTIRYGIPKRANVAIKLYDITGRCCRPLVNTEQKPGYYGVVWDGGDNRGRSLTARAAAGCRALGLVDHGAWVLKTWVRMRSRTSASSPRFTQDSRSTCDALAKALPEISRWVESLKSWRP